MLNKKIFFLLALPRSGNTMFASLMNQNPDIGVTANSITLEIMKDVFLLKETDVFKNYTDHKSLDNVLDVVFDAYYKDWPYKYIIDRGPVMTPGNLMLMQKHLKQPIKCVIIWRDLLDVIASFIKWFENEPTAYIHNYGHKNIEEKCWSLMSKDGQIAKELIAVQNALKPENKDMTLIIKYNDLVNNPENEIRKVYKFLDIPYFNHNYNSLSQFSVNGIPYDDRIVGKNLHTIKTKIEKQPNVYRDKIPQSIINAYGHITL